MRARGIPRARKRVLVKRGESILLIDVPNEETMTGSELEKAVLEALEKEHEREDRRQAKMRSPLVKDDEGQTTHF